MDLQSSSFFSIKEGRAVVVSLFIIFLAVVGLDQISKVHAHNTLLIYENPENTELYQGGRYDVMQLGEKNSLDNSPYFGFRFQYSRNRGAAFSLLSDLADHYRVPFFYAVTLVAVIMIFLYLRSTPIHHSFTRLGLVMILAGALGNFLDRLRLGYVIDFVDVEWNVFGWQHDFAIFNVADVAINVGVIMLILDMIIHRKEHQKQKKSPGPDVVEARTH